jgi:tripartite-type tricarboxylate transporter receptor subunit TctC
MKLPRRRFLRLVAGTATFPILPRIARAQTSRPITVIVPFAAGGLNDAMMRTLAERMRVSLGQSVIVENVGGAAGASAPVELPARRRTATPSD